MNSWYNKTKTPFFIISALTLIFLFSGRKINFGQSQNTAYHIFSVEFQYFGMDSSRLEKEITIPLEEKINEISGLCEMRSVTEQGKVSLTAWFSKSLNSKQIYLTIRNYVDNLYKTLPAAVQKPRIFSSDSQSKSVFCFTVSSKNNLSTMRQYIENTIKQKFESISGVAEVIVSGGTVKQLQINFDVQNLVEKNLNPQVFAQIVQDANVVHGGSVLQNDSVQKDLTIQFDTKIQSIDQIRKLPVKLNEGYVHAGDLAEFDFCDDKQKEIVRINGEEAIAVQIKATSDANIIKTVSECKKILSESDIPDNNYKILTDAANDQIELLKHVLKALLQSFICVILIIPLFYSSLRNILLILFSIPLTALWTVCQLSAMNININPDCIAGLSISMGLVCDPMLVIAEKAESQLCKTKKQFLKETRLLAPAILFSTVTSLLALLPLFNAEFIIPGIRTIICTTGLMLCNSLVISLFFYPCYAYKSNFNSADFVVSNKKNNCKVFVLFKKIKINFENLFSYKIKIVRWKKIICAFYTVLIIVPIFFVIFSGKDISSMQQDKILFISVEYRPEKSPLVIDKQISILAKEIQKINGITFVRSESHHGNAELEAGFLQSKTDVQKLSEQIMKLSYLVEDGFIFIQNNKQKNKRQAKSFEISVCGNENSICRSIAKEAVSALAEDSNSLQSVLNFKENPKEIVFYPDRVLMAKNSLQTQNIAEILHWTMFNPVIDKWIRNSSEYDIKISGAGLESMNLNTFKNLHVPTENGGVKLESLGRIFKHESDGKIYRLNGQRCAYFTVQRSEKSSTAATQNIKKILTSIKLPKGYFFRFSKEISLLKTHYSYLAVLCILATCLIFVFLTALTENINKTLLIISIIPASVSLPLAIKFFANIPLHTGDIVGIAIAGGITVNNAIYILCPTNEKQDFSKKQKNEYGVSTAKNDCSKKSIISSSITTILGAIPLCLSNIQGFPKDIAFFMLLGSISSLIISIFFMSIKE